MEAHVLLILVLVLVPTVLQLMAISVYTERMSRALRRASDRPPFTTDVEIVSLGPESHAIARLLDRATRLDDDEVDALIARQGGRLPLPMSRPAALRLAEELRQLGAVVETRYRPEPRHG